MSKDNVPNLSAIANTGWDDAFNDAEFDSIIEKESGYQGSTQDFPKASTQVQNAPTTTQQTLTQASPEKELKEFLDTEVHGVNPDTNQSSKNYLEGNPHMSSNFKDSGTIHGNQPNLQPNQQSESNPQFEDVYDVAFSLLRELDLIRLPEEVSNLTQKDLVNFAHQTRQAQMEEAIGYVKGQVMHDPFMSQMFDYAYQGGTFADIPRMSEMMQDEIDYSSLNMDSEVVQKQLLEKYYAEGLDYNDPRDKELIDLIPKRIEDLAEDLKLKDEALKAQEFFIGELQKEQQAEHQRMLIAQQQQQEIMAQEQMQVEQWQNEFMHHLQNSNWSQSKKESVYQETLGVQMQDGSIVPQWKFKHDVIMNDPYLFQYFLNFVSYFDPQSMEFVQRQSEQGLDNKTVSQVLDRINSKQRQQQQTQNQRPPTNPQDNTDGPVVDVGRDWFF
jgi:hypothetical protein